MNRERRRPEAGRGAAVPFASGQNHVGRRDRPLVLFVINSLTGGGAERMLATLLSHSDARRRDFRIVLAVLDDDPAAYELPDWVEVHLLDCRHDLRRSIAKLGALVRRLRPALINSHLVRSNVSAALAAWRFGVPLVATEQNNTVLQAGSGVRSAIKRLSVRFAYRRAARVIAVSGGIRDNLVERFGLAAERVEVIPNAVDAEAIDAAADPPNPFAGESPYIVAVGRLHGQKNHRLLLRAFARSGLDGRLIIIGDGPDRTALEALTIELGLAGRVRFAGFLANPFPVIKSARLFALSSDYEGLPLSLIEALALDVPVVSTNCPFGPAEILAGKPRSAIAGSLVVDAGMLVPPGDVDAFAAGLAAVAGHARRPGAGRRIARRFAPQAAADSYWGVFSGALAEARRDA